MRAGGIWVGPFVNDDGYTQEHCTNYDEDYEELAHCDYIVGYWQDTCDKSC